MPSVLATSVLVGEELEQETPSVAQAATAPPQVAFTEPVPIKDTPRKDSRLQEKTQAALPTKTRTLQLPKI
jgi:hypothetical protein